MASGQSYHVLVTQFFKASADLYPLTYTGDWTFESRVDCYEPNDSFELAKAIPTGKVIEAYGIAGHRDYFIRNRDPQTLDWYRFTLTSAQAVEIEFLQVASNQQVNLLLFNDKEQVIFSESATRGEIFTEDAGVLEPGTWYLQVHPVPDTRKAYVLAGDAIPDHLNTPYRFRVNIQ